MLQFPTLIRQVIATSGLISAGNTEKEDGGEDKQRFQSAISSSVNLALIQPAYGTVT